MHFNLGKPSLKYHVLVPGDTQEGNESSGRCKVLWKLVPSATALPRALGQKGRAKEPMSHSGSRCKVGRSPGAPQAYPCRSQDAALNTSHLQGPAELAADDLRRFWTRELLQRTRPAPRHYPCSPGSAHSL